MLLVWCCMFLISIVVSKVSTSYFGGVWGLVRVGVGGFGWLGVGWGVKATLVMFFGPILRPRI